jgi:hypothetical protein
MNTFRFLLSLSYLLICQLSLGQDRVALDKLSDCEGLAKIRATLDTPVSRNCRLPHGRIEKKLMSLLKSASDVQECLLSSAPTNPLSGFSCVDLVLNDGERELTCFRSVERSLLDNYQRDFDAVYNERAVRYKDAASKCSVGNGDVSTAPDSVFPEVLVEVARPRFAFALKIGDDMKSLAYHGYADLNPDIQDQAGAIEVFDVFKLRRPGASPPDISPPSGQLELTIDDLPQVRATAATRLGRQFGQPVIAKIRSIDFKYGGRADVPLAKRESDLDEWQEGISSILVDAGFRELSTSELEQMHLDPNTMGDLVARNLPFGQRGQLRFSRHMSVLIDDRYDSCTAIGELLVLQPEEGVKESYGTIAILLLGTGDCHRLQRRDAALSDELLNKATQYVREEAKNK